MPRPLNRNGAFQWKKGSLRRRCLSFRLDTKRREALDRIGAQQNFVDGVIELFADGRLYAGGRQYPEPSGNLEAGLTVSAMVGTAGNTAERFAEVTASGRSEFPVMRPMAPETVSKLNSIVPPNSAMFAGRLERFPSHGITSRCGLRRGSRTPFSRRGLVCTTRRWRRMRPGLGTSHHARSFGARVHSGCDFAAGGLNNQKYLTIIDFSAP